MSRIILSGVFLLLSLHAWTQEHPAKFVWKDAEGSGRQQTVLFRRTMQLDQKPDTATIHLFADSRYHIYVNGIHLNFGPSRFYTAHPEYDSYDLAPYFKEGLNVVAVEVLTNGTISYQVPLSIGGFIAWGEVKDGEESISLKTPGAWKMQVSDAYDQQALRFSFACGPMEVFDGRKQAADWNMPGFDDSTWQQPFMLANQAHWGGLTPRTIPLLTQDELLPLALLGIYEEQSSEELYTFFIKTADRENKEYNRGKQLYSTTYIYSPVDQEVEVGLWWGDFYLNGKGPLKVSGSDKDNPVRQNRVFSLNQGWNYLFVSYLAIWGGWEYMMAVPESAGLLFSPFKKEKDASFMLTSASFEKGAGIFDPASDNPGDDRKILKQKAYQWTPVENPERSPNPVRDMVWSKPDMQHNLKANDWQLTQFEIREPVQMVFDMGGKKLGRVFCELEAIEGAVVDMAWSEDLNSRGMPFLYKRLQVNAGARFVTSEGKRRYETFKPYGVRYLLVRIDPGAQACTLKKIGVIEQIYPYKKSGSFSCSNPMLDRIWEMGYRTLRVCSEDSYTDTPFRERGLYAGDALPEYGISLATSGDSRLMKRSLMLFQDMYSENMLEGKEEGLNDFVLKTLLELEWYYRVSGDKEFLEALYPNYHSLMQHIMLKKNDRGYYPASGAFIEWTKIDKSADLTAYQALLARSFRIMSALALEIGQEEVAGIYEEEAQRLALLIADIYWDPERKVYHDGFKDGHAIDHHYPISSVYPLLFDLCSDEQTASILSYLDIELQDIGEETRMRKITPYGSFYLFSALYKEGRADLAEGFMIQYWSRMIHQGDDTSWENFDIGGEQQGGQGTASHAWSGHPTFFLSTQILGVKLGFTPGFDRDTIEISPQSETLTWAKGRVPHPAGLVYVDWRIEGQRLVMEVVVPEGVAYKVEPMGRLANLDLELNVKIENSF